MMAIAAGKMVVQIDHRFGVSEALRIRETLERIGPVREVVIDFSPAIVVEDAALLVIADLMKGDEGARIRVRGLTHHRRRLLRYMGAPGVAGRPESSDADPELDPVAA